MTAVIRGRASVVPFRGAAGRDGGVESGVLHPDEEGAMKRTGPPFSADQVGSLLRTPTLKEARARRERGEITVDALRSVEDAEIERVVRKQEDIGLQAVTDGEFRRSWWHF